MVMDPGSFLDPGTSFLRVLKQPGLVHLALRNPFLPPSCPVANLGGTVWMPGGFKFGFLLTINRVSG